MSSETSAMLQNSRRKERAGGENPPIPLAFRLAFVIKAESPPSPMLKFIIIVILLCCPPYGWVALFLWFCFKAAAAEQKKKDQAPAPQAQPRTAEPPKQVPEQEEELMTVKVANGRCELYRIPSGSFVRWVGSDIVQASCGGKYLAAVNRQGRVEIYDAPTGAFRRWVGNGDAVNAQVQGDTVAVATTSGRTELYDLDSGAFRRWI